MSTDENGGDNDVAEQVFSSYKCQSLSIGKTHPGKIAEAALLSTAKLPPSTYPHDAFPSHIIDDGVLSNLQLEGVLYACQMHQKFLGTGERCGFFLGDGTGVGKGRQLAGIILDNVCRGRKKHLWFSVSTDLRIDATRDFNDIGCHVNIIDGCTELDTERNRGLGLGTKFKSGVLFSTYSMLTSNFKSSNSRIEQLISWCGGEAFDGCIMFDECHRAKNCGDGGSTNPSKIAQAVELIQKRMPRARVVYCSATGVSGIEQMAYMNRLGLWGPNTAFPSFKAFLNGIQGRGMGALEMLAIELKLAGKYVSRGLSYAGADFDVKVVELSLEQKTVYDNATMFFTKLREALQSAITLTRHPSKNIWRIFWSCHQRFFKQLCMSMKVPFLITAVKAEIERGNCAVIGLQTTGEANMERSAAANANSSSTLFGKGGGGAATSTLMSLCRQILLDFLRIHFPITIQKVERPGMEIEPEWYAENAKKAAMERGMTEAQQNAIYAAELMRAEERRVAAAIALAKENELAGTESDGSVALRRELLAIVKKLVLPPNPIDALVDALGGHKAVAELTGRKLRMLKTSGGGYEMSSRSCDTIPLDKVNTSERSKFMDGTKLIAIISDAASTGISLHADTRVKNTRRRVHFTLELPWSADKAIQQLGRTHRSNQVHPPSYILVTTSLGGENSFVCRVAKRMMTMGALTKGDRRAGSGQDFAAFNFQTKYGLQAVREVVEKIGSNQVIEGIDFEEFVKTHVEAFGNFNEIQCSILKVNKIFMNLMVDTGMTGNTISVKMFLNRLLGFPPKFQNAMFSYFASCMKNLITKAQAQGKYDEGYEDIHGRETTVLSSDVIYKDESVSCVVSKSILLVDRGVSWEEVMEIHSGDGKKADKENTGDGIVPGEFCVSRREQYGQYNYMYIMPRREGSSRCRVIRPNTGKGLLDQDLYEIKRKYERVDSTEEAKVGWDRIFKESKGHCIHWYGCKNGDSCQVGIRLMPYTVLSGSVLPLWKEFELAAATMSSLNDEGGDDEVSNAEKRKQFRIVRISVSENSRLVGLCFPEDRMDHLMSILRTKRQEAKYCQTLKGVAVAEEATTAIDEIASRNVLKPRTTILSFFSKSSSIKRSRPLKKAMDVKKNNFFKKKKPEVVDLVSSDEN